MAVSRSRPIAMANLDSDGRNEIVTGLIHRDGLSPAVGPAIDDCRREVPPASEPIRPAVSIQQDA